jgi:hypothetical protein
VSFAIFPYCDVLPLVSLRLGVLGDEAKGGDGTTCPS